MFNLRTRIALVNEHRAQERLRRSIAVSMVRDLAAEFKLVGQEAARAKDMIERHHVIAAHRTRLYTLLHRHYRRVMAAFGKRLYESAKRAHQNLTTKNAEEQYNQNVRAFVEKWSSKRSVEISKTTEDKINDIISEGAQEGRTEDEISADLVEEFGEAVSRSRAATIARTETHAASQDASFTAAQGMGINLTKEWVSVSDERTRPDHADANGQEQKMEDYFQLGDEGDELMYPGDPGGDASQVINCRCVCVYNDA